MEERFFKALRDAKRVLVIQAENPDGDSLGSALALEEVLGGIDKTVALYCPVNIPRYLRYFTGWDRVSDLWPNAADMAIIVDSASATLLSRALIPEQLALLKKIPVAVFDHHVTPGDLPFRSINLVDPSMVATGELLFNVFKNLQLPITPAAAELLTMSILSDSLGLTSLATTSQTVRNVAELMDLGADLGQIENRRRQLMRKSPEILSYKAKLIERIEYYLDGQLALVTIPWEEIERYSDQYNPSMLVIDEIRLVEGVRLAAALKTYPDGRITGKLRANADAMIAETVAGAFGGGGHAYAAGFRVYDSLDNVKRELVQTTDKALKDQE
ncbi:MAG: hypothetical protein EOT04_02050 [Candidatus Chaera renei]|uniref:DDH domain-containing protein n=1 Tax=Candidatus Chaera renei TaxID=2506947 RepID=A0A4V1J7L1_9BACT|nr:MAG: hypothetical protein EOT04_02050 [Candidatus Chaera renei]